MKCALFKKQITMDKERIENAAREYAEGITYNQDRKRNCHTDFMAGADWMEKEVSLVTRSIRKMERLREIGKIAERLWHGMDEEPRIKANGTEVDVIFKVEGHDGMFEGTVWIDIDQAGGVPIFTGNGEDYNADEIEAYCYVKDLYELFKITRYGTEDRRNI